MSINMTINSSLLDFYAFFSFLKFIHSACTATKNTNFYTYDFF